MSGTRSATSHPVAVKCQISTLCDSSAMQVPGRAGLSLLGDESIEFYKTPREYMEKRRRSYGDVFLGRIVNKRTIFMTSNQSVQGLLHDEWQNFSMGYKEFMHELFDENVLFLEGDAWHAMRKSLEGVFSHESTGKCMEETKSIISKYLSNISTEEPVVVYKMFKALATRLSIALFLSHDMSPEETQEISDLMTTHWRGIISVPMNMRGPWSIWQSGYSKALTAKAQLHAIITETIKSRSSVLASGIETCVSEDEEAGRRHLLLFVSALIPKAFASIVTSLVLELSKPENSRWRECVNDNAILDDIVLEAQRLWPPFLGGRRVCIKDCQISGYHIPKGISVVYCSHLANRDAAVFPEPDSFKPERWTQQNAGDRDKVWTFGGGPRQCIGKYLSSTILREMLKELLIQYTWELIPEQDLTYKVLPVCRPKQDVMATFTRSSPP